MNPLTQYILDQQPEPSQSPNHRPYVNLRYKNVEISKVYANIIKDMRWLISRMNTEEHCTYSVTDYEVTDKYADCVLCELICVFCELRLCVKEYCYYIELETDCDIIKVVGEYNYRRMLRVAYRHTSYENTQHDIEDCISVDTNMQDHYNYFKNKLKETYNPDTLIAIETAPLLSYDYY